MGQIKLSVQTEPIVMQVRSRTRVTMQTTPDGAAYSTDWDVDSSGATATAEQVLEGESFAARGKMHVGTMPNNGAVVGEIGEKTQQYPIAKGCHDGEGYIQIAAAEQEKLIPENIRQDVSILGVVGTMPKDYDVDSSSATATAEQVLEGESFAARGEMHVGTMPNNSAVVGEISEKTQQYPIAKGYHDGTGYVQIAAAEQEKLVPENIREGVSILGVVGNASSADSGPGEPLYGLAPGTVVYLTESGTRTPYIFLEYNHYGQNECTLLRRDTLSAAATSDAAPTAPTFAAIVEQERKAITRTYYESGSTTETLSWFNLTPKEAGGTTSYGSGQFAWLAVQANRIAGNSKPWILRYYDYDYDYEDDTYYIRYYVETDGSVTSYDAYGTSNYASSYPRPALTLSWLLLVRDNGDGTYDMVEDTINTELAEQEQNGAKTASGTLTTGSSTFAAGSITVSGLDFKPAKVFAAVLPVGDVSASTRVIYALYDGTNNAVGAIYTSYLRKTTATVTINSTGFTISAGKYSSTSYYWLTGQTVVWFASSK